MALTVETLRYEGLLGYQRKDELLLLLLILVLLSLSLLHFD